MFLRTTGTCRASWNAHLMPASRYHPVGQTDSERVFCDLMERLGALWNGAFVPPLQDRLSLLAAFAAELRPLGPANFLYADGDALFAHGHRRIQRESGRIEPPGLWLLQRHCKPGDPFPDCPAIAVRGAGPQTVMLVASVPLTTQTWRPLAEGELVAIRGRRSGIHHTARGVMTRCRHPAF
jgi:predicted glutamine amidotransferase